MKAFKEAISQEQAGVIVGTGGRLSIVIAEGRVCVVNWFMAMKNKGQEIYLDENRKLKCPFPTMNPWRSFATSQVVLADCNVRSRKVGKKDRDALPDIAWRMYRLAQKTIGEFKFGSDLSRSEGECIYCGENPVDNDCPTFDCALCLCSFHVRLVSV